MVWGAVAAVVGGAVLQGIGNERSARAVRRNSRRQMRYLTDYSDAKQNRSQAFANTLSHIGDDYMDQVTRYYNARNSQDRSDRGHAAYAAQEANTIEEAGGVISEIGLDRSEEGKAYTEGSNATDISAYMNAMNTEAEMGAKDQFDKEGEFGLLRAQQEINAGAGNVREDFQLNEAGQDLQHQNRMQAFQTAAGEAARAGDTLTAIGSAAQAASMTAAMF